MNYSTAGKMEHTWLAQDHTNTWWCLRQMFLSCILPRVGKPGQHLQLHTWFLLQESSGLEAEVSNITPFGLGSGQERMAPASVRPAQF